MAGSRGRGLKAGLTGLLAGSLVVLLGACGVISTKDDRALAVRLADQHFPGRLKVIGARTLYPGTGGSVITFSVTDDRDAVVRLRVDSDSGTCNYKACDEAISDAVAQGRARAAELRTLIGTFKECGYEVVGYDPAGGGNPYIVAQPENATIGRVVADVGACVERWVAASGPGSQLSKKGGVGVNLVSPGVAEHRDTGKESWPTAMRMSSPELMASLSERPHHAVSFLIGDGRITTSRAYIARPFDMQQKFNRNVEHAAREKLERTYPQAVVRNYPISWRLDPGRVDRHTGYVLFCERPVGKEYCAGDHAVRLTTDLRGKPVGESRVVRDVRIDGGALRLPPL